ncbi:peptide chain release factor 2 [Carboxydochorda subterranea]|uniref:Peptide chain release factor 2 n=1 Tax=Carboxydichorda subterranea TaxID=3109565 RepID=A0ABZ1C212_9FIRM|nr:peptide chain release factor 2 [Limnochorda sp. L945t]WRP18903.1 peptide chain release factor 2 [Limnochorda sp. L945t]
MPGKRARADAIEQEMAAPGFWDDQERARSLIEEMRRLRRIQESYEEVARQVDDLAVLFELARAEARESGQQDAAVEQSPAGREILEEFERASQALRRLELETLLSGEYDPHDAILSIHPGAGGTESQDWAQMLLRMYRRWAEESGFKAELLDLLPGDEAGIKSATLAIKGTNAYGYLRSEKGVHRLVRISPFDASGRRHTSFASVDVLPDLPTDVAVEVDPESIKVETFRAGGHGGQYVNKTESAVRITHLPTGIVVSCQSERSQLQNREAAMRILKAKLLERKMAEQREKLEALRGEQGEIAWGNQIRSYVFCPYTMVKDHRTGYETSDVQGVMDGELQPFIEAYLRWQAAGAPARR